MCALFISSPHGGRTRQPEKPGQACRTSCWCEFLGFPQPQSLADGRPGLLSPTIESELLRRFPDGKRRSGTQGGASGVQISGLSLGSPSFSRIRHAWGFQAVRARSVPLALAHGHPSVTRAEPANPPGSYRSYARPLRAAGGRALPSVVNASSSCARFSCVSAKRRQQQNTNNLPHKRPDATSGSPFVGTAGPFGCLFAWVCVLFSQLSLRPAELHHPPTPQTGHSHHHQLELWLFNHEVCVSVGGMVRCSLLCHKWPPCLLVHSVLFG